MIHYVKLLIEANSGVSSKNFFLVCTTLIGMLLLIVPAIILLVEVFANKTITTDLNGMAAYIGAVAGLFATAGLTKAWSDKYKQLISNSDPTLKNLVKKLDDYLNNDSNNDKQDNEESEELNS